ncbi:MAG: HAMP domain-containing protein [Pseudomonadales bacterium]|nr:HAMP domain-containing protein [Pseudomonadales bacterium]
MNLIGWLPGRSLFGRVSWIVVIAMLVLHVTGFYFYGHERLVGNARTYAVSMAQRLYEIDELLVEQPNLLSVLQTPGFSVRRAEHIELEDSNWPHLDELQQPVRDRLILLGLERVEEVVLSYSIRRGTGKMEIVMPSKLGDFLHASAVIKPGFNSRLSSGAAFSSLFLLLIVGVVLWLTKRQARQLERFVGAAELLADGRAGEPLPEKVGPKELRRASSAFNQMQAEVLRLLRERSDMLAGVSHDIRTLTTRLGLRLEKLPEERDQQKADEEIGLITNILDQVLTFTRDEISDENRQQVDLVPLLETLIVEIPELDQTRGEDASSSRLTGESSLVIACESVATTRLFMNLIDNAMKYGGGVRVFVGTNCVEVIDPGQGFATEDAADALKPYSRLDQARSQNLPGAGLGLSIAANVCRRHGWQLEFCEVADGFKAIVHLEATS